jgi:hypothetical protein
MRTVLLMWLLILPWQLSAQDAEPGEDVPQVEDALTADPDAEPEVILEPPDAAAADEPGPEPSEGEVADEEPITDVPGRVARLSLIEGNVSIAPAGTEELAEAVLNRPLTSGDRVLVDNDGRAELQIGNATIHLDGGSGLSLVELSDGTLRASLTEGTAVIRVRRKQAEEIIEVATPNSSVELLRPGEYSVAVDPDGRLTQVRSRSGEAQVYGSEGQKPYSLRAKQQGEFTGTEKLVARITALGERTDIESFANDRERRDLESRSSKYVSRDVIGYEDLDEDGEWIEEPEYGTVWRPRYVDAGWAPYRNGRWAFIAPWGWTWIDQARWGFAPFHYGRWAYLRSRWCWVPGPRQFRPIYAPALVGWTGRSTVSVSFAFGSGVGWFPLAPREIFVPHYRYSRRYARNVNISNTIVINNTTFINNIYRSGGRQGWGNGRQSAFLDYRYRRQANAVTLVERDVFVGGRGIDGRFRRLDARQWQRASHDGVPPLIDPQRSSLLAARPIQRTGWQQRFARAERAFVPRGPAGVERGSVRPQADANNGARGQRWQDRGTQLQRTPTNGFTAGQRGSDQAAAQGNGRRWQDGGAQLDTDRRRERAEEIRGAAGDRSETRRWQDRRGDQQSERRRELQGGNQAQPQRWQDRRGDQQSKRRTEAQGSNQAEPRRWQDRRGEEQSRARRARERSDQDERRSQERRGDAQAERGRWQDRGGQHEQRREEPPRQRSEDRGQRQQSPQPEQRRDQGRRDEGRSAWQQRSNDNRGDSRGDNRGQSSRGNQGQPRWQRQ